MRSVDAARLERGRERALRARAGNDRHPYFYGVAQARYVLRKVFRLVEDEAKRVGIDPLAHQALIQIYGSEAGALRVKDLAERLDITPAFASNMLKLLVAKKLVTATRDSWVQVTKAGRALLHAIDDQVQIHVDYFTGGLSAKETEAALSILLFYAGVTFRPPKAMK
jgi:DNA-binding MarR family transcriptional regulator